MSLNGKVSCLQDLFKEKLKGIREIDHEVNYVVVPGWVFTFDFSFSLCAECLSGANSVHIPYQLMVPSHEKWKHQGHKFKHSG